MSTVLVTQLKRQVRVQGGRTIVINGGRGPKGDKGDASDYACSILTATGAISALRVVRKDAAGSLQYCDGNTAAHAGTALGVSLTAVGAGGGTVSVVTSGRMGDNVWAWTIGQPVYCGANGVLTQNAATPTAWIQQIGVADSATSLVIGIQTAIVKL
ncbi:MAG: hypothetical protein LLG20_01855 [Acidobacteriales bacterium]|nr:hypothetical protein [Terriglobales bacterium]